MRVARSTRGGFIKLENIPGYIWLIGAIVSGTTAVLGALLGSRYFADKAQAKRETKREIDSLHKQNHGEAIKAETSTIELLLKRIQTLEETAIKDRDHFDDRLDRLNERVATEMQNSAKLLAENEALKTENVRQAKRLHDLADAIQHRDGIISQLRQDLENFKREYHETQAGNKRRDEEPIKVELVNEDIEIISRGEDLTSER